jgi:antitoxin PrlF
MPPVIEETSTITARGQTTVPKSVRRLLGVDYGGKIAFRIEKGRVSVRNAAEEHRDPALSSFLAMIERDICVGRNLHMLPKDVAIAMRKATKDVKVDLDEVLDGDVAL